MGKLTNGLFLVLFLSALGACDRVKEKEAVADLPKTSTEDTLVLTPDTLEVDTVLSETDTADYAGTGDYEEYGEEETASGAVANRGTATATSANSSSAAPAESGVARSSSASGSVPKATASKGTTAKRKYVRPTRAQLQQALARDARRSNQMDLPQLRNYWLRRQHYYRRASKDVKYVAGDTKIKISTEETKIETPRGKVKIEGNDIKIKYDD
ncbi:hypothetical protein [Rufibacter roseolus]|uniref:hypothetical protein n=1 Tax=Rufibacter roseolus TaxID=2817375 RepID=UPI001B312E0E|nr:hypothetical protein [Rufibacter roseolus]